MSMTSFFFFTLPTPPVIYTLSLHDALPICRRHQQCLCRVVEAGAEGRGYLPRQFQAFAAPQRSQEGRQETGSSARANVGSGGTDAARTLCARPARKNALRACFGDPQVQRERPRRL